MEAPEFEIKLENCEGFMTKATLLALIHHHLGSDFNFLMFIPICGRFPFWLIFVKWVETTNQSSNAEPSKFIPGLFFRLPSHDINSTAFPSLTFHGVHRIFLQNAHSQHASCPWPSMEAPHWEHPAQNLKVLVAECMICSIRFHGPIGRA